ncbi:MAG: plasmid pRiA4b ORF-3 family protein [Saprospiraceae bacterium]|nr:plasmid pRiA4b ORF-3 family protein [Saprospiraceae bacterium]MDZ4705209.1 plasmid pRiA4b ORF-3 family protein [Saprospiraceae bacterium]
MSKIYQLKITLKGVKPPVWRRVEVPAGIKLSELNTIIQDAMGWIGYHLHNFEIWGMEFFPDKESIDDFGGILTSKAKLDKYLIAVGQKGRYAYDFGDDWQHEILLEKILDSEKGIAYPRCMAGKRACPPEDCGGTWGYANLLEALKDPKHPEHKDMMEWMGGAFDPEAFDLEGVNERMRG